MLRHRNLYKEEAQKMIKMERTLCKSKFVEAGWTLLLEIRPCVKALKAMAAVWTQNLHVVRFSNSAAFSVKNRKDYLGLEGYWHASESKNN